MKLLLFQLPNSLIMSFQCLKDLTIMKNLEWHFQCITDSEVELSILLELKDVANYNISGSGSDLITVQSFP